MSSKPWFVYILRDDHDQLYIGITQNLSARLAKHRRASGSMHTAKLYNLQLAYTEKHPDRPSAATREKTLKHLPRAGKLALLTPLQSFFAAL